MIRYDRRGYAKSRDIGPPYGVDEQIADLALVIDRHAPGRSIDLAFGHSFGGNVVLGLAAQRPELIARTAVYETPLSWLDWWPNSGAGGAAAQADQSAGRSRSVHAPTRRRRAMGAVAGSDTSSKACRG